MQRQANSSNDKRTLCFKETAANCDIIRSAIYVLMALGSLFFHRFCPSSQCFQQELCENLSVRIAISDVFDEEISVVRMGVPVTPYLSSPLIPAATSNDSSWPGLSRPSTPASRRFARRKAAHSQPLPDEWKQLHRMDGRDKPGHDGGRYFRQLVLSALDRRHQAVRDNYPLIISLRLPLALLDRVRRGRERWRDSEGSGDSAPKF
jgi:hypothetical protein